MGWMRGVRRRSVGVEGGWTGIGLIVHGYKWQSACGTRRKAGRWIVHGEVDAYQRGGGEQVSGGVGAWGGRKNTSTHRPRIDGFQQAVRA